jgi:NAD-dependent deacetylase
LIPGLGGGDLTPADTLESARAWLRSARGIYILTGAGVSAESGVPTFRDALEGEWAKHRPEDLATPEAFRRDPAHVWAWYALRQARALVCAPNPGHLAIARIQASRPDVTVVTQNVDGLHRRALAAVAPGLSLEILEIHGSLFQTRCVDCSETIEQPEPVDLSRGLPRCGPCGGLLRPAVVWFGEPLPELLLQRAFERAGEAEVCVVAGTSALVHPAAALPLETRRSGGRILEVNPDPTPLSRFADLRFPGPAGIGLPALLDL